MSFNDEVDGWISQLMQCKPLSEAEVKKLCDKVSEDSRALFPATGAREARCGIQEGGRALDALARPWC
jgi:serine/threonine-protein phosphatase 2A catalytic subunit